MNISSGRFPFLNWDRYLNCLFFTAIFFQTHKQPVTEYEAIREKAATQKRDIERALTKFLAKTSETHNLFNTEDNQVFPCKWTCPLLVVCIITLLFSKCNKCNMFFMIIISCFSVIACKPTFPAYLPCLLPTDQVFDFDELEYHFQVANRTEDMPAEKKGIIAKLHCVKLT